MEKKTVGILGGMGPLATADLFRKIIEITDAKCDQEHVHVLIDSNTNIPDRTAAILHGGKDPVPELTKSAKTLAGAGADLLIMPCNTAHYFYDKVQEAVKIPVLSIIEATADRILAEGKNEALILCTDGTKDAGVYDRIFEKRGIRTCYPDAEIQKDVMSMIYEGVKAGVPAFCEKERAAKEMQPRIEKIEGCAERVNGFIAGKGGMITVLACTELPIAKDIYELKGTFVDPTACLAEAAVRAAGYPVKEK